MIVLGIFSFGSFFFYKTVIYQPPACTDGKENGGERGVDCGGSCIKICPIDAPLPTIFWTRILPSGTGVVDLAAFVENPQPYAGNAGVVYAFRVYDTTNRLIVERKGKTFVNPREQFAIVVPNVPIGTSTPRRIFLDFEPDGWERVTLPTDFRSRFSYEDQILTDLSTAPRLRATVKNESTVSARNIEVVALLYDAKETLVGSGITYIDQMARNAEVPVVFVWKKPFDAVPVKIEIIARLNSFLTAP